MSAPPIRLLVSDIDGTLVRKDKALHPEVIAAVDRLHDAGVAFSLISARPVSGMVDIARTLRVSGPIGAYNGGTIARPDGAVLTAERLSPEAAHEALRRLDQDWTTIWLFADGKWHAQKPNAHHDASERKTTSQEPTVVSDLTPLLDRVDKMVAVSDDEPRLAALERETTAALGAEAAVARSQPYYLDVTAPGADKGAGVTTIAKAMGVPLEQVAVVGDGGNDVAMFRVAALSCAMGNGSDAVRGAATHVVRSNEEDGVADAIDRYVLPASRP